MRKSVNTILILFAFILLAFSPVFADTNLWVLWGQSNMEMAPDRLSELGISSEIPHNAVYYKNDDWNQHLSWPSSLHIAWKKVGPEIGFLPAISNLYPNDLNVVLKVCRSGTAMDRWTDGADLYALLLSQIQRVVAMYGGDNIIVKAVFGIQGESDGARSDCALQYGPRMRKMISGLRRDLKLPDLPFFVTLGRPVSKKIAHYGRYLNQAQLNLASQVRNVWIVTTLWLTKQPDHPVHWDTKSEYFLGHYMVNAWKNRNH